MFNHPMFGAPGFGAQTTELGDPGFGRLATATTNNTLGGGGAYGVQRALHEVGGPRSAQFTLKLPF